MWVCRDIEDGAVDGDVDGFCGVGAVVGTELVGGEVDCGLLLPPENISIRRKRKEGSGGCWWGIPETLSTFAIS
jgi:hypothetical protein